MGRSWKKSDNGGEYIDSTLETWFREKGIQHQATPARCPQCNGVSERINRTVQDRGRSMLVGAGLEGGFWVKGSSDSILHSKQGTSDRAE